ncbi:hypothetical protein [Winogradskyella sp.]|uniref:hypothetical protein n=1 Tax=Winogradskyella sp. TaxID=1883156 RepID=UPI0035135CDD
MNRLHFSIKIKAERSKIWKALWDESAYRDWISVFEEDSYAISDNWKEGGKVMFLGPGKNGIYSSVVNHIPNKIMQFKHIGIVKNGKEQPIDEETRVWSGATETYKLLEEKDCNTLVVEIDVMDEHLDFMKSTFPKALGKIKNNCT